MLNPVRAGICATPEEWRWSSYRACVGLEFAPTFLAADELLRCFGDKPAAAREAYRSFVSDGIEDALALDDFALLTSSTLGFDFLSENDRAAYRRAWAQDDALAAMVDYYRVSGYLPPRDGHTGFGDYAPEFRDKTIEVPTLVIYAEGSPYARPATLDGLEDFVPDLRLERVTSETHWLHEEQPEVVNRLVRAFLDENTEEGVP